MCYFSYGFYRESIVQLFVYNDKIIAKLNLLSMLEYSIMQPVMEQQLIKILKFGRDGSQHRYDQQFIVNIYHELMYINSPLDKSNTISIYRLSNCVLLVSKILMIPIRNLQYYALYC